MAGKVNKEWHIKHPMPEKATLDERIEWHLEHARKCKCREMPPSILAEMNKRKIKI